MLFCLLLTDIIPLLLKASLQSSHCWNSTLKPLTVQNEFLDIVTLEQNCLLWKRLMYSLPEKQLFLSYCMPVVTPYQHLYESGLLDKADTLGVMTLFCRFLFTTLRRIYHYQELIIGERRERRVSNTV